MTVDWQDPANENTQKKYLDEKKVRDLTDFDATSPFHTLGGGSTQAAPGNHAHKNQNMKFGDLTFGKAKCISNTNLNDLNVSGFYDGTAMTNAPSAAWWYILHVKHSDPLNNGDQWAFQMAVSLDTTPITRYFRHKYNNVWQAWV
jgi:hypothetical protein